MPHHVTAAERVLINLLPNEYHVYKERKCNFILGGSFTHMGQTVTLSDSYLFSNGAESYCTKSHSKNTQLLLHINTAFFALDKTLWREIANLLKACFSHISHGHASSTPIKF